MTSSINTTGINVNYPVAGVDNNSQGFRDNFAAITAQFTTAASEITTLQNFSAVNNAANNFNGNTQQNFVALQSSEAAYQFSTAMDTGVTIIDWQNGSYQFGATNTTNGTRTVSFSNFGSSGSAARMTIELGMIATGTNYVAWPASVNMPNQYEISVRVNTATGAGFIPGPITVENGSITTIAVAAGGSGYLISDTITISGGGVGLGPVVSFALSGSSISTINVLAGGSGFQNNITGALSVGRHLYEFVTKDGGASINLVNYQYYLP